jgi:hypothetical protein
MTSSPDKMMDGHPFFFKFQKENEQYFFNGENVNKETIDMIEFNAVR